MKRQLTVRRKGKVLVVQDFDVNDDSVYFLAGRYQGDGYDVWVKLIDRPCFDNFDDYVKLFPEGEKWRKWVTTYPSGRGRYKHYALVPAQHSCLPGDYACVHSDEWDGKAFVRVNDGDDFMFSKEVANEQELITEIEALKTLAPWCYSDLASLGYTA